MRKFILLIIDDNMTFIKLTKETSRREGNYGTYYVTTDGYGTGTRLPSFFNHKDKGDMRRLLSGNTNRRLATPEETVKYLMLEELLK